MIATAPARSVAGTACDSPALEDASILSFAVDRWTDVPRCRHHVMSRLARRNRVIFASSPWHVRDAICGRTRGMSTLTRADDTLYTYTPPRWLPYTYRLPGVDRWSRRMRAHVLNRVMKRLGMDRPILYLWHPSFVDMIDQFDERLVVYHCYDEYSAFRGADRGRIAEQEARILASADLVFTVSEGLYARKRPFNRNTHLVRNGVDYPLFMSAADPATPLAEELRGLPGPVVGCVTRIVPEYFDAALLRTIFTRRPDWTFVVVGPECSESADLSALRTLPNVRFLGRRELTQLPSYLKGFDACLIPYVLTENKQLADPLKLYEYLAAGKPVVSKPLTALAPFRDVVSFASDAGEWIDAIDHAIRTDSRDRVIRRQQAARQHTWDDRVETIGHLIAEALTRKSHAA